MDVFDLFAKISLDTSEYDKGLDDASKQTSSFGTKLKNGLATAGKVAAAGIGAATAAVGALAKTSLDSYGEYEQLKGGVETLFKTSADVVLNYANNAYRTAGLSANEYMNTVTSFSASLLQSLDGDTQAAADKADKAITDMADNANKMGTDISMLQNAYQGFAKQNFTMLDNLKLGYGGTKEEMQRLLDEAEKLPDAMGRDFDISNYADIVDAIHLVQDSMGIAGATQEEAFTTIQGSLNAAKSAWQNLVTGIADGNADLDVLIGNFVNSVSVAGKNIIPRVEQILVGIGEAVAKLAPILGEQIPAIIVSVLPSMLDAGTKLLVGLVTGIINAMPDLVAAVPTIIETFISTIGENLPAIAIAGTTLLSMFSSGIMNGVPIMLEKLPEVIDNFLNFITSHLPEVLSKGVELLNRFTTGIIEGIPDMLSRIPQIISSFVRFIVANLPVIAKAGMDILANLVIGIINKLPEIGKATGQIIGSVVDGINSLMGAVIDVGKNIVAGVWDGIVSRAKWIKDKVVGFFGGILEGAQKFLGINSPSKLFREQIGQYIGLGVAMGIEDNENKATKAANDMAKKVYDTSKDWADRQSKYMELSYGEQAELWETIQGQFVEGSKQYLDAEERVFDLRKKQMEEDAKAEKEALKEREKAQKEAAKAEEKALKERENALEEYAKKVESINEKISDLEENYQKELANRSQSIFDSYSLFEEVPERQKVSGRELMRNLKDQVAAIEEFYSGLDALAERGVGDGLIEELRGMGPDAINELDALLALSDEKLSEYATLFAEKQALANDIATKELSSLREDTDAKIMEQIAAASALYEEYAPDAGLNFTKAVAIGIEEGTGEIENASVAAALAATDAFNRTLDSYGTPNVDISAVGTGSFSSGNVNAHAKYATSPAKDTVIPVTLEIDGEVLARKTYRYNQSESARIGQSMVRV